MIQTRCHLTRVLPSFILEASVHHYERWIHLDLQDAPGYAYLRLCRLVRIRAPINGYYVVR